MEKKMTLEQFAEIINASDEWKLEFSEIIRANGWIDMTGSIYEICETPSGDKLVFGETGTAVVLSPNWAIIAHCDPYNSKSHYHGERVVKFDGATPVSWLLKEFSTKAEAIERLEKFFKGDYQGEIDYYESESAARKDLEDMGIEEPDTTFWKGAGYYHTESKELIFRKGDESYSFDTLSYYIDQI